MRNRARTWRRLAAWMCLFAWMLMIVGPLHHASGHKNDHIHVGGMVVPMPGAAAHQHDEEAELDPSDLIAQARGDWSSEDGAPADPPSEREDEAPTHGFDTLAHFGAAPLAACPTLTLLEPPELQTVAIQRPTDLRFVAWVHPHTPIRGPPASSAVI